MEMTRPPLRMITYGLFIGSIGDGEVVVAVLNWITQASFEPPLLVVALKKGTAINRLFREKRFMTINVVPEGDLDMVKAFFGKVVIEGDKANGYRFKYSARSGGLILMDSLGYFDVELVDVYEGGDHDIFIVKFVDGEVFKEGGKPIVIWDTPWYYGG